MTAGIPLLVIIGAPGAGKSRIGKRVAQLLRCDFVDTDRRIVAKHGPIPALFTEFGEEHFRSLERAEVAKALRERAVVALGGGAIVNADTRSDLAELPVALVTVSADAVKSRIRGSNRPLLTDGIKSWQRLVDSRREIYESLASRTWDTSARAAEDVAADIAAWIRSDSSHTHEETRRTPQ